MPEYRSITKEAWEQYAVTHPTKADEWKPIMEALEAGDIIEIPVTDTNTLRGMRIGLGRRAKQRGLQLEYRSSENTLAVQRVSSPAQSGPTMDVDQETGGDDAEDEATGPISAAMRRSKRRTT